MFRLVTERGKFLRIRENIEKSDVTEVFSVPADGLFCGKILELSPPKRVYRARIGDTYETIARDFGISAEEIRELNSDQPVYPTKVIWIP